LSGLTRFRPSIRALSALLGLSTALLSGAALAWAVTGSSAALASRDIINAPLKVSRTQATSYWLVSSTGQVFSFGKAKTYGSEYRKRYRGKITGIAGTSDGKGYWIVTSLKREFAFGDAKRKKYNKRTKLEKFTGSVAIHGLHGKIVGIAVATLPVSKTPTTTKPSTVPTTSTPVTTPTPTPTTPTVTHTATTTTPVSTTTNTTPAPALAIGTTALPDAFEYSTYSGALQASGGSGSYTWEVLDPSDLPSGFTFTADGTLSGYPEQTGSYQFEVEVADSDGDTATGTVSLALEGPQADINWSGYAEQSLNSTPYTSASGTFDVPSLNSGDSTNDAVSEWVGIDGYDNENLIQAGVAQSISHGVTNTHAWWEILPASETEIPTSTITVSPGDQVTVSLTELAEAGSCTAEQVTDDNGDTTQVTGNYWDITVEDDTTGQSYSPPEQCYGGQQDSSEWIVEAPEEGFDHDEIGCYVGVAAFSPEVTFTNLITSQTSHSLDYMQMLQDAGDNGDNPTGCPSFTTQEVTPSLMDSTGFNDQYGDTVPAAP
jgi:hypothetical protein